MKHLSKLQDKVEEKFERKEYLKNKVGIEARTMFKFRSQMFCSKMNYRNNPKFKADLWLCDSCQSQIDTQSHVLFCPAYQILRADKDLDNDKHLVQYLV